LDGFEELEGEVNYFPFCEKAEAVPYVLLSFLCEGFDVGEVFSDAF